MIRLSIEVAGTRLIGGDGGSRRVRSLGKEERRVLDEVGMAKRDGAGVRVEVSSAQVWHVQCETGTRVA